MNGFHSAISTAILYFAMPKQSLQELAKSEGISKQAVPKRIALATPYIQAFQATPAIDPRIEELYIELDRERQLNQDLRRQLVICRTLLYLAEAFKEIALKFFPTLKLSRLSALQKKYLLDMLDRFQRLGGKMKEFCTRVVDHQIPCATGNCVTKNTDSQACMSIRRDHSIFQISCRFGFGSN
jgi:hypothetical protein